MFSKCILFLSSYCWHHELLLAPMERERLTIRERERMRADARECAENRLRVSFNMGARMCGFPKHNKGFPEREVKNIHGRMKALRSANAGECARTRASVQKIGLQRVSIWGASM